MSRDLAREIGRQRIATARHRRLADEMKETRRLQRRARRTATVRWWRRRPGVLAGDQRALSAAPAPRPEDVTSALTVLLERIATQIAEHGTGTEREALLAVHDAARWAAPGAAAALVDWDGPEPARLRAFGVLHGIVLGVLDPADHAWLLERLRGGSTRALGDRVA
jgi:hypothetical protein